MTITGNYTQTSAGVLEIDLGGLAPGTFDRLVVNGDATLAGAIGGDHGGFAPVPGSTFGVVTYASKTGSLDALSSTIPAPSDHDPTGGRNHGDAAPRRSVAMSRATESFTNGLSEWQQFATPNVSYLVANVTDGVLEFYRVPPPPGQSNQAVVLQDTGLPMGDGGALEAHFDLGNSSSVRKRISVLVHDGNFSDLSVCTFWLRAEYAADDV